MEAKSREDEYAALGFVPTDKSMPSRIEADFVKFVINNTKAGTRDILAVDSYLSDERECSLREGLCEDDGHRAGSNNVIRVESSRQTDVSSVDFIKKRTAVDELDADISSSTDTMVLVAIGSLNTDRRVTGYELDNSFDMENGSINFNSKVQLRKVKALDE